jgi:pullulanase
MTRRWIPAAVLFLAVLSCSCSSSDPLDPNPQASVTMRVAVPAATPVMAVVYMTGDFQGWDPGDPDYALTQRPDGRWEIQLDLPEGQPIEFKFSRGDWATIEKGSAGEEIPNRTMVPAEGQVYESDVARWADM